MPVFLRPVAYVLPLTYGADVLHGAVNRTAQMPAGPALGILTLFCIGLFLLSLRNIRRRWIL
jgi:ABC-2 type transport system permease protein